MQEIPKSSPFFKDQTPPMGFGDKKQEWFSSPRMVTLTVDHFIRGYTELYPARAEVTPKAGSIAEVRRYFFNLPDFWTPDHLHYI